MILFRYMRIDQKSNQMLRPSLMEVEIELGKVKRVSWILAFAITFILVVLWPAISVNFEDFSLTAFKIWIIVGQIFVILSFLFLLTGPLVEYCITKIFELNERRKSKIIFPISNMKLKNYI